MNPETKEKKKISVAKLLLIALGFILLTSASELLYNSKNNDNFRMSSYLYLTRLFAKTRNLELSHKYLSKASEIRFSETIKKYPEIEFEHPFTIPSLPENQGFQKQYLGLLSNIDYKLLSSSDPKHLSKIFYQLGLIAYENNDTEKVIPLWQTAVYLAPEWSYFHIELANYYLSEGMVEEAKDSLSYCLKFRHPKEHCQWYIENFLEKSSFDSVGFLETKIDEEI